MRRRIARSRRRAGFTMLEMLAALAILAMAAALAGGLLRRPSPRLRLEAATRAVCATLRAARSRAIASNRPAAVVFDLDARSYVSPVAGLTLLPRDMNLRLNVAQDEAAGGKAAIRFFPDGGASGGDVFLELGGRRAAISVNWMTGGAACALDPLGAEASR